MKQKLEIGAQVKQIKKPPVRINSNLLNKHKHDNNNIDVLQYSQFNNKADPDKIKDLKID